MHFQRVERASGALCKSPDLDNSGTRADYPSFPLCVNAAGEGHICDVLYMRIRAREAHFSWCSTINARSGRGADVGLSEKWSLKMLLRGGTDEHRFPCVVGALAACTASRMQRVVAVGYTAICSFGGKCSQRQGCVSDRRAEPPAERFVVFSTSTPCAKLTAASNSLLLAQPFSELVRRRKSRVWGYSNSLQVFSNLIEARFISSTS